MSSRARLLALATAVLACNAYTNEITDLAYVHFGGSDSVFFSAPDTVLLGETFQVSVRTYGGGCTREGSTRVTTQGQDALVEPFDITDRADVCTLVLREFTHRAAVRFDVRGNAVVRVRGRARTDTGRDTLALRSRAVLVK